MFAAAGTFAASLAITARVMRRRSVGGASNHAIDEGTNRFSLRLFASCALACLTGACVLFIAALDFYQRRSVVVSTLPPKDSYWPGWFTAHVLALLGLLLVFMAGSAIHEAFRFALNLRSESRQATGTPPPDEQPHRP
jgi:hypothetical protein